MVERNYPILKVKKLFMKIKETLVKFNKKTFSKKTSIFIIGLLILVVLFFIGEYAKIEKIGEEFIKIQKIKVFKPEMKEEEVDLTKCLKLAENCLNKECPQFEPYCSWSSSLDLNVKNCTVYECAENEYLHIAEIEFTNPFGKNIRRIFPKEKTLQETEKEMSPFLERCKGELQIIDNKNCSKVEVKVITKGKCRISNFIGSFDNKNYQTFDFFTQGDSYFLAIPDCQNLKDLIAVGERGISIK